MSVFHLIAQIASVEPLGTICNKKLTGWIGSDIGLGPARSSSNRRTQILESPKKCLLEIVIAEFLILEKRKRK